MRFTISILLPTRGRPHLVRRFFESVLSTAAEIDQLELVLYVDEDDPQSWSLNDERLRVDRIIGPRVSIGAANTACLERSSGDIVILMNDDVLIRTPSWDRTLLDFDKNSTDKIYLAYGNDLFKKRRVATFPILSRRCCEVLGQPFPRSYHGGLIDVHLMDIFKRLSHLGHRRIFYFPELVFEHAHYRTGQADYDPTYAERERFGDDHTFVSLRYARQEAAERLAEAIGGKTLSDPERESSAEHNPAELHRAFIQYFRVFLMDRQLSLRYRSFLFVWFIGRFLAKRGYFFWITKYKRLRHTNEGTTQE